MKLYEDIEKRTGGNIYIGVTGPVRVGKSTFVKRIMEELVLPNITDEYRRERAKDELPQSGSGKTIMTAEPKFVPEEAVEISPDGKARLSIRLIDSVGYMIPGALGALEDGQPRMVTTPWFDHEIPMTDAAELGTKKVMENHCTVGIVLTTDGSVTDIPREDYAEAEKRAIADMAKTGKPYVVLVNSVHPLDAGCTDLVERIKREYKVGCYAVDALTMSAGELNGILTSLLYEFSVEELQFSFPGWFDALEPDHPAKKEVYAAVLSAAQETKTLSQAEEVCMRLCATDRISGCSVGRIDLGQGTVSYAVSMPEESFYAVLSEKSGVPMENDADLMQTLSEYRLIRAEYDRICSALDQVKTTGYGIVMPSREEVELQPPQLLKKNGAYGVKLTAKAPTIHLMRADITTDLSPMVGEEKQSQELADRLLQAYESDDESLWESNLFGKTVFEMVNDSLNGKIQQMPEVTRQKIKNALTRIVNEGANGLICLIL